jgi:hypothetical protein
MGHYARNCPNKPRANINQVDFDQESYYEEVPSPPPEVDRVGSLKDQLGRLTDKEREDLAKEMGIDEDFPTA